MFEFRLKWFNQEREEEHLVISPPPPLRVLIIPLTVKAIFEWHL